MHRRNFLGTATAGLIGLAAPSLAETTPSLMTPHDVYLSYDYPEGQILVSPDNFRLYLILPGGKARVYPIRVGRDQLYEAGTFYVGAKKEWPSWVPTPGMIKREPEKYAQYAEDGIPGGPGNPLGARAIYLFQEGRGDTFLRIHGTDDPATIGRAVSNGCAGLTNDHIVDLYDRVQLDAPVFLYPKTRSDGFTPGNG